MKTQRTHLNTSIQNLFAVRGGIGRQGTRIACLLAAASVLAGPALAQQAAESPASAEQTAQDRKAARMSGQLETVVVTAQKRKENVNKVPVSISVVKGEDLQAKNKAGKALLSLPNNAKVIAPRPVADREQNWLASVTTEGRLLIFKISDLPQLGKGKGNKIIGISGERVASREEYVTDIAVLPEGATLVLQAGKRTLSLKADDLEHYKGERGRRGNKLPRGFQRVDALLVENLN